MVTRRPKLARAFKERDRWAVVADGFRWVVLDRTMTEMVGQSQIQRRGGHSDGGSRLVLRVTRRLTELLGSPVAVDGRIVIWDLTKGPAFEAPYTPTKAALGLGTWPMEGIRIFEQDRPEIGSPEEAE